MGKFGKLVGKVAHSKVLGKVIGTVTQVAEFIPGVGTVAKGAETAVKAGKVASKVGKAAKAAGKLKAVAKVGKVAGKVKKSGIVSKVKSVSKSKAGKTGKQVFKKAKNKHALKKLEKAHKATADALKDVEKVANDPNSTQEMAQKAHDALTEAVNNAPPDVHALLADENLHPDPEEHEDKIAAGNHHAFSGMWDKVMHYAKEHTGIAITAAVGAVVVIGVIIYWCFGKMKKGGYKR